LKLLFASRPNHDSGDIFGIDKGVEKLRAGQLGKMDNLVAHFFDLAADLFAGVQAQLDRLTSAALQDAEDSGVRLQFDFVFGRTDRRKLLPGEVQEEARSVS
jgi:hypothetical protein